MVYLKLEMKRKVSLANPTKRPPRDLPVRKAVMLALLEHYARRKASEEHGYYLGVDALESVGEGEVHDPTGSVIFPVTFTFISMKPVKGDIFIGAVDKVLKEGLVLKYGPIQSIFLSEKEMKGYRYEEAKFVNERMRLKIGSGSKVRFGVVGSKWIESDKEFQVLATLGDDGAEGVFGPI